MLFNYAAIGLCTLNKPILNIVIRMFPFLPTQLLDFFIGKIYCGGATPKQVIQTGEDLSKRGINNMMLSLTIEDSEGTKNIDINYIVSETIKSVDTILKPHILKLVESGSHGINDIPPGYIAIKPSAVISNPVNVLLNYKNSEYKEQWNELNNNCAKIIQRVAELNTELAKQYPERRSPFFVAIIDAEKYDLQQGVYQLQRNLYQRFNKADGLVQVVGTIQMYLKDAMDTVKLDEKLAKTHNYRVGLKLVRGAYIHSEPNRGVIHDTKEDTDICYNSGIQYVLKDLAENSENATLGHLVVASHNGKSSRMAADLVTTSTNPVFKSNVVLGQLLGMADDVTYDLIEHQGVKNIIKYVPWGPPLETKDYLLRRLQENGDAVRNDNGWPLVKNVLKVYKNRLFG
jgi:proline dehydrogenase